MILCCGETLIDFVPIPGEHAYRQCAGGSIMNIAVGLGRLQVPVAFFCKISTDFFGEFLVEYMRDNSVDVTLCPRDESKTTLAFDILPEDESKEPQFAFYANDSVDRNLTIDQLPPFLEEKIKCIHFGSISLVLEPGAAAFEELMRRESGKRIITLDPNIRPEVIDDRHAYLQRFEAWLEHVDILRLSTADLDWMYPNVEWQSMLPAWFKAGISLVIVTQGAGGSSACTQTGKPIFVPAEKVSISDTVGAGDTFFAAALAFLHDHSLLYDRNKLLTLNDRILVDCLAYAGRAAAINCTREGANPPYKHEMA
jgi:fructokinase